MTIMFCKSIHYTNIWFFNRTAVNFFIINLSFGVWLCFCGAMLKSPVQLKKFAMRSKNRD